MTSDMGTSMARENVQHVRLVDRTAVGAVRFDDRQRRTARHHTLDDVVQRRSAADALDGIELRRRAAHRIAAHEAAELALAIEYERVFGAAVERRGHPRGVDLR